MRKETEWWLSWAGIVVVLLTLLFLLSGEAKGQIPANTGMTEVNYRSIVYAGEEEKE